MKPKRIRPFNIPMALTWSRIAFIPLIVGIFYLPESLISAHVQNLLASVMFAIAALTDALDGYIARRYHMETVKGAFLDSVADKLIVCSAIVVLLNFKRVDMIVAFIIVGREITITALREWMARIGRTAAVKVNWYGKVKTILQMLAITILLYFDPIFGLPVYTIGTWLIYAAAVLTLYSMCIYMLAAWPHIEAQDD